MSLDLISCSQQLPVCTILGCEDMHTFQEPSGKHRCQLRAVSAVGLYPSSNSGNLAPLVLYPGEGLKPNEDYKPVMSGGHDKSALGVLSGDYDMGGVASDVFERMVARGTLKADDFRIIYKSPIFPTSSFARAHDLKPELAKKLTDCFFAFRFPESMQKEFNGDDRFFPITYKETWKVVRDIAEGSGTPYNKAAYEAESKREAEALAKKQQQAPAQPKQ